LSWWIKVESYIGYLEFVSVTSLGQSLSGSLPALGPKLSPLMSSLITALLHALSDTSLRKSGVIHLTSLLLRLNQGTAARDAFLAARTGLIRKRTRMIGFEGEISVYVSELALVVFTSIKHTADWYLASFKENDMASGGRKFPHPIM
jgi:exocyst complex component 8